MIFTQKHLEKLVELAKYGEVVTVSGINYCGQTFNANGKLLVKRGKSGKLIYASVDALALYQGQKIKTREGEELLSYLSLSTNYAAGSERMYVDEISLKSGEVIYKNADFEKIEEMIKEKAKNSGQIKNIPQRTLAYTDLIGNPVVVSDKHGARSKFLLKAIEKLGHSNVYATLTDGTVKYNMPFSAITHIEFDSAAMAEIENHTESEQ